MPQDKDDIIKRYGLQMAPGSTNKQPKQRSLGLFENQDEYLKKDELAVRLRVGKSTIDKWRATKSFPTRKIGRSVRFNWKEVEVWLQRWSQT